MAGGDYPMTRMSSTLSGWATKLKVPNIKKYWNTSLRHTEIASLELEFHQLVSNPHSNAARASEILSTLAQLYQTELNERASTTQPESPPPAPPVADLAGPESEGRGSDGKSPLVKECQSVIDEAKQSMASSQSSAEIRAAFRKGVMELMDTLGKDGKLSP